MKSLFAGEPADLSLPDVLWDGDFRPVEEIPPPVRHAAGYELFADQVWGNGEEPAALVADVRLLVGYLQRWREELRVGGEALLDSAGVFLGNTLIARVHDASWVGIARGRPEVGQFTGGGVEVFTLVRLIVDSDHDRVPEFDHLLLQWDGYQAAEQAREAAEQRAQQRLVLRNTPVRPSVPFLLKADAHLVSVLDDLIDYLMTYYVATVSSTRQMEDDPQTISPTARTIRLTPEAPDAAPLVIAIDSVGAVAIRAGALHEFFFYGPDVADLEDTLLAVAAGLYRETYPITTDDVGGYRLGSIHDPRHFRAGGTTDSLDPDRLTAVAARLGALRDGWRPWPLAPARRR